MASEEAHLHLVYQFVLCTNVRLVQNQRTRLSIIRVRRLTVTGSSPFDLMTPTAQRLQLMPVDTNVSSKMTVSRSPRQTATPP